jgi:hypothetical protein
MRKLNYKYLTLIPILGLILFSCKLREDKIFAATDEMHYIHLYENGNEFEILYNGVNKAKGTYSLIGDTVILTYHPDENKNLTKKLLIDTVNKKIRSLDDRHFCAEIYLDKRTD